jgi:hypothetical protein
MFILDVLQHDVAERVESIIPLLNNPGCIGWRVFRSCDFRVDEVVRALRQLVADGLVVVYAESHGELVRVPNQVMPEVLDSYWFGRSQAGIAAWDAWQPPLLDQSS